MRLWFRLDDSPGWPLCAKRQMSAGFVSVSASLTSYILLEASGLQSLALSSVFPVAVMSTCDASAVLRGVGKSRMHAPLHHFHIQLKLATG